MVSYADKLLISSVRQNEPKEFPQEKTAWLNSKTLLPISIDYQTPHTLGLDRIASAVGAWDEFAGKNSLIIDLGTCITYDLITRDGTFRGGAIAPGIMMRAKSMHQFTGKLPLIELKAAEPTHFPGKTTAESMRLGVLQGVFHEISGYIYQLEEEIEDLHVILTGGDTSYFETKIKAPIFVRPEIILTGLNRILLYNEIHA